MYESYEAKPWLVVGVGYVYGRLTRTGKWPQRTYLKKFLASEGGYAKCACCPELGEKWFRRRHTLARFLREHRHCGKPRATFPRESPR